MNSLYNKIRLPLSTLQQQLLLETTSPETMRDLGFNHGLRIARTFTVDVFKSTSAEQRQALAEGIQARIQHQIFSPVSALKEGLSVTALCSALLPVCWPLAPMVGGGLAILQQLRHKRLPAVQAFCEYLKKG
jgi:hypothetical protein